MKKLQNLTNETLVFNLPHALCCALRCTCSVQQRREQVSFDDGSSGVRTTDKRIPGSVTLLPKAAIEAAEGWLKSTEVRAALDRKAVRLIELTAPPLLSQPPIVSSPPNKARKHR